ncbi:hypothetical protein E4U03_12230 [Rothia nasimurium]|uniref:Uncharacterized protein n=1 Tax=Rothia nasimurium TaxID=85336 RepID=A0A4Y9F2L5_9MICC|nr:hypothetical protein [Rothia nasimurium]MBF0809363.1 hypothetical protein [Rothia nasimurium]TFU19691.1 hypothetical protein E4U03_12230 [Rothia nasimurium]
MNQFRGVKPTGNLGAVARKEVEDLLSNELKPYPDKGEVSQMIQTQAPAPDLSGYATIEQVNSLDPLPTGGSNGQILARVGRNDAEWVNAPDTGIAAITSVGTNTVRVTLSNGQVSDIPITLDNLLTKTALATLTGYWEVISEEEPEEISVRLPDGKTVPVKWTRPLTKSVPVFPEPPVYDDYAGTVLVAPLVGVSYRVVGGDEVTPGQWVKVTGATLPVDVTVEAVAAEGYELLATPRWVHTFPDPEQSQVFFSDSFDRADGQLAGAESDSALGGITQTWQTIGDVRGDDAKKTKRNRLVQVRGNALELLPSATIGADSYGWYCAVVPQMPENWRLEFDLTKFESVTHGATPQIIFNGIASGAISFTLYQLSVNSQPRLEVRLPGDSTTHRLADGLPLGRYVLERFGRTVRAETPTGVRSISIPEEVDIGVNTAPNLYFRNTTIATNGAASFAVDNVKITKLGF